MARGEEIGSFETTITSWSHAADGSSVQVTVDGTADNYGTVLGTVTSYVMPGASMGACSWSAQGFLDNGEVVYGRGGGSWEELGQHRWRLRLSVAVSNGTMAHTDGVVDLASRSYKGKFIDWS